MSKKGKLLQTPKLELMCNTGAQVDCISRKTLLSLGLGKDQLRKPQILLDCANKTEAEVLGVFFGEVLAMEGNCRVDKVKVIFYEAGLIDEQFPNLAALLVDGEAFQEYEASGPDSKLPCRCLRREFVDPPSSLPF